MAQMLGDDARQQPAPSDQMLCRVNELLGNLDDCQKALK